MEVSRPKMFEKASCIKIKNVFLHILIFYAVFFVVMIAESIVPMIMMFNEILQYFADGRFTGLNYEYFRFIMNLIHQDKNMIATLICTIFGTIVVIIHCRFIEKRTVSSMGVVKENFFRSYLKGMLVGFVMISAVVFVNVMSGAMTLSRFNTNLDMKVFLLFLLGFLIQGSSEEFIFRGYLMNSIGSHNRMMWAVFISAAAFSLAHILNPGVTPLALVNILLFGIFMSMYMIYTENIWGVSAIHSIWNFCQGNIYGISVSGTGSGETLFSAKASASKTLINGGSFGIEGGIVTTFILIIAFFVLFFFMKKSNKIK